MPAGPHIYPPRICISSTGGSGGKTLFSLGLARALVLRGQCVKPFKKGPDYIDAAWLSLAANRETTNLDLFFLSPEAMRRLFLDSLKSCCEEAPLALIEGNRGLFDGLDESGSCSTAAVARSLGAPVLLCLNCVKSTRTMAAVLRGLECFEDGLTFAGVILNRVGSMRHEQALRRAIEACTDMKVLGALPRLERNPLPERHMGLACHGSPAAELAGNALDSLARMVEDNCDLPAILQAAQVSGPLPWEDALDGQPQACGRTSVPSPRPRIGYVHDEALWFHYPENLAALRNAGAETVRLSLLDADPDNARNWDGLAALYLVGGFPEDYASALGSSPYLVKILELAEAGLPVYAECGGLILLCRSLEMADRSYPMAGVFSWDAVWHDKPAGLGYVAAEVIAPNPFFPVGLRLRGHEFHYSSLLPCAPERDFVLRLERGSGLSGRTRKPGAGHDALLKQNVWGSYMHIFAPAVPCWAPNMVSAACKFMTSGPGTGNIVANGYPEVS